MLTSIRICFNTSRVDYIFLMAGLTSRANKQTKIQFSFAEDPLLTYPFWSRFLLFSEVLYMSAAAVQPLSRVLNHNPPSNFLQTCQDMLSFRTLYIFPLLKKSTLKESPPTTTTSNPQPPLNHWTFSFKYPPVI